jgi:hypothetical protein
VIDCAACFRRGAMDTNQIRTEIEDLSERAEALRRYL